MNLAALLAAAAATVAAPSPEALDLARQVAANGLMATLTPLQTQGEVEGMIAEHPELTADEQAQLRKIGDEQARALLTRAIDAEAEAMARALSVEDLRALAAFAATPAARRQHEALPQIMLGMMQVLGDVDYGASVKAAFCGETGKLCESE